MTPSSTIVGALVGSLLLLAGWIAHDYVSFPPNCRDSFRRIHPEDIGVQCPYPSQSITFIDLEGKAAVLCSCRPMDRRGTTVLL